MTALIVIAVSGVACYLLRIGPAELLGRAPTPPWLDRVAVLSAPVAFAALAATALAGAASGGFAVLLPRLVAVAVAAAVAHRTRSTAATIGTGMLTLWLTAAALANW
jgi:branched-subunit amino acid transport protein